MNTGIPATVITFVIHFFVLRAIKIFSWSVHIIELIQEDIYLDI